MDIIVNQSGHFRVEIGGKYKVDKEHPDGFEIKLKYKASPEDQKDSEHTVWINRKDATICRN